MRTLQNSLKANRVGHAYLFSGPRGTGKTTTAKILAKAVNCLSGDSPVSEPCNQCELCAQVNSGQSIDVLELDAATNRGIEEIRDLRERVRYAPAVGRYKVYIIDEVHMLTTEAFNALLKTLEEPPAHVIFILATTEAHKIPATILSRCQRFDFRPLSEEQIAAHLCQVAKSSDVSVSKAAAELVAFRAQGGMRDALGLLEQVIAYAQGEIDETQVWEALGTVDRSRLIEFINYLGAGEIKTALEMVADFSAQGVDMVQLLSDILDFLRQCLVAASGAVQSDQYREITGRWRSEQLMALMDLVASELKESKYWLQPRLAVEMLAVRACREQFLTRPESKTEPVIQQKEINPATPPKKKADSTPAAVVPTEKVSSAKWEELLKIVKHESISTYAWLKEASASLKGNSLQLNYPKGFMLHRDNIVKGEHRQNIVPALKQVFGVDSYEVDIEK